MEKTNIIHTEIHEERCTGYVICKLWCSYTHYKTFNPSKANLEIEDKYGLKPKNIRNNKQRNQTIVFSIT